MEGNYLTRNTHKEDSFSFEEHTWGTSWPSRNYGCSFCKREFKSAQALGGHMNVHRRDRARLRSSLLSSWVSDQCPKPNPNIEPNNHLSDEFLNCAPLYGPCDLTLSSSFSPASTNNNSGDKKPRLTSSKLPLLSPQSKRSTLGVEELMEEEHKVFKNNENMVTLELGIGLLKNPKDHQKLDLELRLGNF